MSGRLPNFIIGGAPKCGTTSLANYLRDHHQAFVCGMKEPFYFATDMPAMSEDLGIHDLDDYRKQFSQATDAHVAVGEGSTLYLYSDTAIENAIKAIDDVKFVFMVRRPAQIAHAYHMQMRYYENESEPDFEKAWYRQDCRKNGECPETIPTRCLDPKLLQYRAIASVGTQLERAFDQIPESRRRVFLFDDFVSDASSVYHQTIEFLGLEPDDRTEFAKDNSAMKARSVHLSRMLRSSNFRGVSQFFKKTLPPGIGKMARSAKVRLTTKSTPRQELDSDFQSQLNDCFRPEVEKIESLLNRDLTHWK